MVIICLLLQILTKDSVTVFVNAIMYYKVIYLTPTSSHFIKSGILTHTNTQVNQNQKATKQGNITLGNDTSAWGIRKDKMQVIKHN